jgi:uncharacterized delta-60 repeat protein
MYPFPLGFLALAGAGGVTYWLSTLGGASAEQAESVATDTDGNSYSFGNTSSTGAGSQDFLLVKYDPAGVVQWQRVLGGADGETGYSIAIDSSSNVYAFGYTGSTGAGLLDFLLAKYNSSGTLQWQRILGSTQYEFGYGVAIDSSSNVYVSGVTYSAPIGSLDAMVAKYDSSGTLQWQKALGGADNDFFYELATDSGNNLYALGHTESAGAGGNDFLLAKYNSAGTIQWQRVLGGTGSEQGFSVAIDASDNAYILGQTASTGAGGADILLAKYNSSGTLQWQRVLGGADGEAGYGVAIDSFNNVYLTGKTLSAGAGSNDLVIAKYNSAGTIQWQRVLGATGNDTGNSIAVDADDTLYVLGSIYSAGSGSADFFLAKLPNDGSLTGTYVLDSVDFVYAASSLTASTSTLTAATSSLTSATTTLTAATSTLTSASASLTSYLVNL